jgi:hypothetical protein
MHIWILFTYFACIIKVYQLACFYIAIDLVAIICWLKLRKPICYHPLRWPLWTPILYPCNSGLLISSKAFRKLLVEPKIGIQWGIYPAGRHYGSPNVALGLCSNMEVDCQDLPGRYILHRVDSRTKVDERKALIGCLLWHMMLCGEDAHMMSIRMIVGKVYNLCRV